MKALRYLIAPLALGMALTGVSASAAVPAEVIELGNDDNTKSWDARDGQQVVVQLHESTTETGLTFTFGDPASTDGAVVAPVAGQKGTFKAVGAAAEPTAAAITAEVTCVKGEGATEECPDPVPGWKVTINVAPVAAPE